jgi:hypothetical protein
MRHTSPFWEILGGIDIHVRSPKSTAEMPLGAPGMLEYTWPMSLIAFFGMFLDDQVRVTRAVITA